MATESDGIIDELRRFVAERDWDRFHTPKNLTMAMMVEAAELMEHFQWLTSDESRSLTTDQKAEIADEIADVQIYLTMLADRLGIDIETSVRAKIRRNAVKYPVKQNSDAEPG